VKDWCREFPGGHVAVHEPSEQHLVALVSIDIAAELAPDRAEEIAGALLLAAREARALTDHRLQCAQSCADEKTVYYRADVEGLERGQPTARRMDAFVGRECTYATTNLQVARAFAVEREVRTGIRRSVYRVELAAPICPDPDFAGGTLRWDPGCFISPRGTVLDVVDLHVDDMTIDEAFSFMAQFNVWPQDGSPLYDDNGYVTVPTELVGMPRVEDDFRALGKYPEHDVISALARRIRDSRRSRLGSPAVNII
jgi:hypothetical protein